MSSISLDELKKFYKLRAKKPELYTYDDIGNLIEKDKDGEIKRTITLPTYRQPTFEEFDEMEQLRISKIAEAEEEYEKIRQELRQAMDTPDTIMSDILRLNRKAVEADIKLQNVRFPLREVVQEKSVEVRDILFEQNKEVRKLANELNILITRPFTLQDQYVRIDTPAGIPIKSLKQIKQEELQQQSKKQQNRPIILFAEPYTNDYGYLSMKWDIVLNIDDVMYNSAYQALMASMAIYFEDETNLTKILSSTNPDDIKYNYTDISGNPDDIEIKWNIQLKRLLFDINLEKFNQHPELAQKLIETGNSRLGYYEPDDNQLGIGISLDDERSKDPNKWSGQNLLGITLEQIREQIKSSKKQLQILQQQPQQQPQSLQIQQTIPRIAPPPQQQVSISLRRKRPTVATTAL
jgi:ribA/ribD-fused uncharacterized protein